MLPIAKFTCELAGQTHRLSLWDKQFTQRLVLAPLA